MNPYRNFQARLLTDRHLTGIPATKCSKRRTSASVRINRHTAQRLSGKVQSSGKKVRYSLDNSGRTTLTLTFDTSNVESTIGVTTATAQPWFERIVPLPLAHAFREPALLAAGCGGQ